MIKEYPHTSKYHYYGYLDLLKKIMINEDKETVDDLFDLQFSLFFNENNINEKQIKILSRLLCRESLEDLLHSTWFLRKKHCSVAMNKNDMREILALARNSKALPSDLSSQSPAYIDWGDSLSATINLNDHLRLIQAVIKPLFIWWVGNITPDIFVLYEKKKALELQINQYENIKLLEAKQPSNISLPFLSLSEIRIKLDADKARLLVIEDRLKKDIKQLITMWKTEPIFNIKISDSLSYIRNVKPQSELLVPIWDILNHIPEKPEYGEKLKEWLLKRSLCLKNDKYLWY